MVFEPEATDTPDEALSSDFDDVDFDAEPSEDACGSDVEIERDEPYDNEDFDTDFGFDDDD
ncbi:hypothetical protein G6L33_11175 [Agrobacterium rhizogenes]|nr:hypothetical protein [Rhizobium rhizogenes]NTH64413.1 hypothetical protein [Rhizobium rhizogenes]NTJ32093.1 hypothetical protein [Rhizobium rhizogenes]